MSLFISQVAQSIPHLNGISNNVAYIKTLWVKGLQHNKATAKKNFN